jgi:predicted membrane protein
VPHGALVGMLFGMSILWVYGFGFTPQHRIFRYLLSPLLGWILLLGFGWIVFCR